MTIKDLVFEPVLEPRAWYFDLIGQSLGNVRALCKFKNGYALSVVKGSYLTTYDTYEIGILKQGKLLDIHNGKEENKAIKKLGLKKVPEDELVYGFVTEKQINDVMKLLENKDDKIEKGSTWVNLAGVKIKVIGVMDKALVKARYPWLAKSPWNVYLVYDFEGSFDITEFDLIRYYKPLEKKDVV